MKYLSITLAALWLVSNAFASPVYGQTPDKAEQEAESKSSATEIQAQIDSLMGELSILRKSNSSATTGFTANLGLGSNGAHVVELQQMLVAQGHLTMPAGVAYGYFGPLTRSAVSSWQEAHGILPATGNWGPFSRSRVSGAVASITVGGTISTSTSTPSVISTVGVEGTLTASLVPEEIATSTDATADMSAMALINSSEVLSVENDSIEVLSLELTASSSDIRVERVKIDLGANQTIYRDIVARVHIMEGGIVLATRDLSDQTVVREKGGLSVTISGMSLVIPRASSKTLTVVAEARHSINSVGEDSSWTLAIPVDGIRGVDGTSTNVYAPETALSGSFTVQAVTTTAEDLTTDPLTLN